MNKYIALLSILEGEYKQEHLEIIVDSIEDFGGWGLKNIQPIIDNNEKFVDMAFDFEFDFINEFLEKWAHLFGTPSQHSATQKVWRALQLYITLHFGDIAEIHVRSKDSLESVIKNNPYERIDENLLFLTFLDREPVDKNTLSRIESTVIGQERIRIIQDIVYLYAPSGYQKTVFDAKYFEDSWDVIPTTRNWKTVNKLHGILQSSS